MPSSCKNRIFFVYFIWFSNKCRPFVPLALDQWFCNMSNILLCGFSTFTLRLLLPFSTSPVQYICFTIFLRIFLSFCFYFVIVWLFGFAKTIFFCFVRFFFTVVVDISVFSVLIANYLICRRHTSCVIHFLSITCCSFYITSIATIYLFHSFYFYYSFFSACSLIFTVFLFIILLYYIT